MNIIQDSFAPISLQLFTLLLLSWILKVAYSIWWKPRKLKFYFEKQGITGPPYKLLYGNIKEKARMTLAAKSKPMDLSHKIVTRVSPFTCNTVKNYGKVSLTWHGTYPRLIVTDPELIKEVFLNKFGYFEKLKPNPLMKSLFAGLFVHEGEKWAMHRRIVNPAFHIEKLKGMLPAFTSCCIEMIERWDTSIVPQGSCELDMWAEFQILSRDGISRTAFSSNYKEGTRISELQGEEINLYIQAAQNLYIPGFRFLPTKNNLRRKQLERDIKDMLRSMINRRLNAAKEGEANKEDLMGLLMESASNDSSANEVKQNKKKTKYSGMTIEDVTEECKLFYLAGEDTTSLLLTWTMITLCMHPSWQARARDEVLEICGKNTPDFDGLNQLKIVTMVLNETFRLYSPVVEMFRQTSNWVKLGDINLPPDVQILLPTLLVHHDPEIWGEDAEEFKPERFSEGLSKAANHPLGFFPFGWGSRICIGQNFTMIEARLALAMILQHFRFELSPSYVHAPCQFITTRPQFGAQVILHKL